MNVYNCTRTWKLIALTSKSLRFAGCCIILFLLVCFFFFFGYNIWFCEFFNSHRLIAFDLLRGTVVKSMSWLTIKSSRLTKMNNAIRSHRQNGVKMMPQCFMQPCRNGECVDWHKNTRFEPRMWNMNKKIGRRRLALVYGSFVTFVWTFCVYGTFYIWNLNKLNFQWVSEAGDFFAGTAYRVKFLELQNQHILEFCDRQ